MKKKSSHLPIFRKKLEENGISGFIIPSNDEFQNEYVPLYLNRLKFLTGFTGSNGVAIITKSQAALFTDGRYLLQAEKELGSEYKILDMYKNDSFNWFDEGLGKSGVLGYDPMLHTPDNLNYYRKLGEKFQFKLKAIENNLVDALRQDANEGSVKAAFELDLEFTGKPREDKIKKVCQKIDADADYLLITNSDAICWLLNIRGYDVEFTPFLLANMLLAKNGGGKNESGKNEGSKNGGSILYCDPRKLKFNLPNIEIKPLEELKTDFQNLLKNQYKIQIDPKKVAAWFSENHDYKEGILFKNDPIDIMKACKNSTEIAGFREAHLQDGIALAKFLCWLLENWQNLDETGAAAKLLEFRSKGKHFVSPSFHTISAYGANGAIIHYNSEENNAKALSNDNLYLLDSGGQYLNGTTDVTRTVHFGKPTTQQKKHFTLVLKGHIALAKARFPAGTTGEALDVLARSALWQYGLDYAHGTGHGVGHFLSVHEGPQRIGKARSESQQLLKGMILSNEPGYYLENNYGIRIENLMLVVESSIPGFLEFETLTLLPIQRDLVDDAMLTEDEKEWLDNYNKNTIHKLGEFLDTKEKQVLSQI